MNLFQIFLIAGLDLAIAGCGQKQETPSNNRQPQSIVVDQSRLSRPVGGPEPSPVSQPATLASETARNSKLPLYEIKADENALRAMEGNPFSNDTQPATFITNGEIFDHVQVRFRGQWARTWPKKPLKIIFGRDKPFQEHHSLNLNSGWHDPAFVRETLAYHVYDACGVPASRSRLVRVHVNGQFRGLYVEVEQVDKTFLRRFDLRGASLFKSSGRDNRSDERDLGSESEFAAHYANETQPTNGVREVQQFCQELARTTNTLDFFNRRVDTEKYINYLAATALVQHWDCFNKNHFLVHDAGASGKWFVIPWDLDRTFGDHWNWSFGSTDLSVLLGTHQAPGVTGWNRLEDRFFSEPSLRARFLNRLEELLEKEFTTAKLHPILDRLESEIAPEAALDRSLWPGPAGDVHSGIAGVKSYIKLRIAFLQKEIKTLRQTGLTP